MAYTNNPALFLLRILLIHLILSHRALSVLADTPLRGRDGIQEYVPRPGSKQAYTPR